MNTNQLEIKISDQEIESRLHSTVSEERRITAEVIELIRLAERRKIYLQRGYSNLYQWLTQHFHYSGPSAYRRIQAARLLEGMERDSETASESPQRTKDSLSSTTVHPASDRIHQVSENLKSGVVNLSTLSKVQSFIQAEEKRTQSKISVEKKSTLLKEIEQKSIVESEKILFSHFPEAGKTLRQEKLRAINQDESRLSLTLSEEDLKNLERAKELLAHQIPNASYVEVIRFVTTQFLQKKDLSLSKEKNIVLVKENASQKGSISQKKTENRQEHEASCDAESAAVPNGVKVGEIEKLRKPVAVAIKKKIWQRDQGKCQYVDRFSGKKCESRYQIEIDHVQPVALGGENELANLRCLCRAHNSWRARESFGGFLSRRNQGVARDHSESTS